MCLMKTRPLIETNPYLKNAAMREKLVTRSVVTSCGVEGVAVDFSKAADIKITKKLIDKPRKTGSK